MAPSSNARASAAESPEPVPAPRPVRAATFLPIHLPSSCAVSAPPAREQQNKRKQRRDLIAKLLKATPQKSNRQIAKAVGVSHPHVGKIRTEMETAGDVETVSTSIDTKGRRQQAKRATPRSITSSDRSGSGVSEVPTTPEKLTSGLLTGSLSQKIPADQAEVVETPVQLAISEIGKKVREVGEQNYKSATHLIGSIDRFAEFCEANDPELVARGLMSYEVEKVRAGVAVIETWLGRFDFNLIMNLPCDE